VLKEVIEVDNQFYILAGSSLSDDRTSVLKQGDTFGIFDHYGDIHPYKLGEQGIFHNGTRFLSVLDLKIENTRPLFLSTSAESGNELLSVDLSNPDFQTDGDVFVPRGTVYLGRTKFLWEGACYERLQVTNFGLVPVELRLALAFNADFVDIFEVRGSRRPKRGERSSPYVEGEDTLVFSYRGLDNLLRLTRISFQAKGLELTPGMARVKLKLQPRESEAVDFTIRCETESAPVPIYSYPIAFHTADREVQATMSGECHIESSNELFNEWVNRSMMDIRMMLSRTPQGLYPYAGIPWFSTPFGRDGIITALETLWVNPSIARGVLAFLAAVQGRTTDPRSESDPGKILHEMRGGEMAALGEIPFGRYYGTVDATPLFVMLAGAYYEQTGDLPFIDSIWPNIVRALEWIDHYGDSDGDLFVEYFRRWEKGLLHQGWKDSQDAVMHADGRLAVPPIALCEVQGYVYAAKHCAARLSSALGNPGRTVELEQEAASLKAHFDRAFWCDDISTYALALDANKDRCRVRSSNSGHCLFTGIATTEHAGLVAQTLMQETSFSGWGIRTLDCSEVRYNPMSYHNGSVWPHDNALIAYGLSAYGFKEYATRLLSSMFDLSQAVHLNRLPELFCGFPRRPNHGPTLYPVACAPQAWAAGAVFMTLQACLGMQIDARSHSVHFDHPMLPQFIDELRIRNLRVGETSLDLTLRRYPDNVGINIDRRSAPIQLVVLK
jgi:glycogen debranching enzyme